MEKTRKKLLAEFLLSVTLLLVTAFVFELGLVEEGLWGSENGLSQFVAQSVMTTLLFVTIPCSLYLFRIPGVRRRLVTEREAALLRWGSVRMMLLCVPMIADMAFYYLFGSVVGFFYMVVIYMLTLPFVFPTKRRCESECLAVAAPQHEEGEAIEKS